MNVKTIGSQALSLDFLVVFSIIYATEENEPEGVIGMAWVLLVLIFILVLYFVISGIIFRRLCNFIADEIPINCWNYSEGDGFVAYEAEYEGKKVRLIKSDFIRLDNLDGEYLPEREYTVVVNGVPRLIYTEYPSEYPDNTFGDTQAKRLFWFIEEGYNYYLSRLS